MLAFSRIFHRSAALLACLLASTASYAACLSDPDGSIRKLDALVEKDATQAVKLVQARLAQARLGAIQQASPGAGPVPRLASLYAVEARGYSLLELDAEARASASMGLALAPEATDPVHLNLLMTYALNVYDAAGLASEMQALQSARRAQARGSVADLCLQITLGTLQLRQGRADQAIINLTEAYRASATPQLRDQHVEAAAALSSVMRTMGDFSQALALNQEQIDRDTAHGATLSLSVSTYLRAEILKAMEDYRGAIEQFARARKLSTQVADEQGVAFADLGTCEVQIALGQSTVARPQCESALQTFTASRSTDVQKQAQALLARIDLNEGHADRALASLNRVLDHHGSDMPPRVLPAIYRVRAQTNAALGKFGDAYADLAEYLELSTAWSDKERREQSSVLRAHFETDREIERNAALERELLLAHESARRQQAILRWTVAASTVGALTIVLLTYILIANLRHRRELLRLATQDSLTGLPNRGRTVELASAAVSAAVSDHEPLTIALIDLDHFKAINDLCGHATGDRVLQEFAHGSRQSLRPSDTLGRWGGEEFLLVLPGTTLDAALAIVERIRALALRIQLPSNDHGLRVTLSAGLATTVEGAASLDEIVARADAALYEAKHAGRDLVRVSDDRQTLVPWSTRQQAR